MVEIFEPVFCKMSIAIFSADSNLLLTTCSANSIASSSISLGFRFALGGSGMIGFVGDLYLGHDGMWPFVFLHSVHTVLPSS